MSEIVRTTPNELISKAIDSNIGIEQLEKLMDLQERWERKEAMKAYFDAMNRFQAEKPDIKKTSGVSHDKGATYKYFFASLAKIQKAVDPVLSKHGLSYSFKQESTGDKIKITCVVKHVDGYFEETFLEGGADSSGGKNAIQAVGSSVSYLKRYTLKNALGLSEDDDDGLSSQLSKEEIDELALDKLKRLREDKKDSIDEQTLNRLDQIIADEESSSYKKAIKILEKL